MNKSPLRGICEVAASVAGKVRALLDAKSFPESMANAGTVMEHFDTAGMKLISIEFHPMMEETEPHFETADGEKIVKVLPAPVAEVLVRAILPGRSKFDLPTSETDARLAISQTEKWIAAIREALDNAVAASAAGSGYEERLCAATAKRRRYGTYLGELSPAPDNLINRDFQADHPNQKWLTDIT
ncbi:MAG: hypothetical protein ACK5YB_01670, partial [Burkholderiales bacterium]